MGAVLTPVFKTTANSGGVGVSVSACLNVPRIYNESNVIVRYGCLYIMHMCVCYPSACVCVINVCVCIHVYEFYLCVCVRVLSIRTSVMCV